MKNITLNRLLILFSIALNIGFISVGLGHYVLDHWNAYEKDVSLDSDFSGERFEETFYHHYLNLSESQYETIHGLLSQYRKETFVLSRLNRQMGLDVVNLLKSFEKGDEASLEMIVSRIAENKKERELLTANHLLMVKEALTDTQKEKLFTLLQKSLERKTN